MFNLESDFLALDFDGVIADSIGECLVIGHNAYVKFTQAGQQICRLEELNKTHKDECRRLRNFIRSGEDYVYIVHMGDGTVNYYDDAGLLTDPYVWCVWGGRSNGF